jgi:undecaprenyl-diphosphatase
VRLTRSVQALDTAAYALAHRGGSPRADRLLHLVTRSADFSSIWVVSAAALCTQGRDGRRAAARGLLSLGITSALVNGPVKTAVQRQRPSNDLVPVQRVTHRRTRTTSFPSGHSASAAAFTVGAATELPVAALPLGVLAALVGASRVRTGAHYPGDVLGGFAAGAAIAVATRRVWPVRPAEARRPAPGFLDPAQARPTGRGVGLAVNPGSGPAFSAAPREVLQERLPDLRVVEAEEGDLETALEKAATDAEVLGAAGGDGSANAAARVALDKGLPLLVVPTGTLNHFAHELGLESVEDAADAVAHGSVAEVDVGCIGDHVFLNTASVGAYVDLVRVRERWEERLGKWPAFLLALGYVLLRRQPLEVELDGEPMRAWAVFFGNGRYDPPGFAPTWRERLDDRLVDVRVLRADQSRHDRLRLLLAAVTGRLDSCAAYEQKAVAAVRLTSLQGPLRLSVDGEVVEGDEEVVVTKAPGRLRVYARLT